MLRVSGCIFAFFYPLLLFSGHWEYETWQNLIYTNLQKGRFTFYTAAEARESTQFNKVYYYRISECLLYQANPWWDFEAHYSYLQHIRLGEKHFVPVNRWELEANPHVWVKNKVHLAWRNRMEFIRAKGDKQWDYVFRHRIRVEFPLTNCGKLKAFIISEEIFYNFRLHKFNQSRFIPLDFSIELAPKLSLDLICMIRTFHSVSINRWTRSLVFMGSLAF